MAFWQKKGNRFYSELISHTHTKKKEKKRKKLKLIVCFHLFIRQLPEHKPRARSHPGHGGLNVYRLGQRGHLGFSQKTK